MERITINQIAGEFSVASQIVVAELKKLGIYVTATASVDGGLAERVRKKLQALKELAERAANPPVVEEKKPGKKAQLPRRATESRPRKTIKLKTPAPELIPVVTAETRPAVTMAPRKGRLKAADYLPAPADRSVLSIGAEREMELPDGAIAEKDAIPAAGAPPVIERPGAIEMRGSIPSEIGMEAAAPKPGEPVHESHATEVLTHTSTATPVLASPTSVASPSGGVAQLPVTPIKDRGPKPQILKKTVAESPTSPGAFTGKIFRPAAAPRPVFERPKERGRFVPRRKEHSGRDQRGAAPIAPVRVATPVIPEIPKEIRPINLTEGMTVRELAERLDIKAKFIMAKLLQKGILAAINQSLDTAVVEQICQDFGFKPTMFTLEESIEFKDIGEDLAGERAARPPVVTIMGHVDHGKTTLLDAIRATRVAEFEAGGITQHIGAYKVDIKDFSSDDSKASRHIVFLDTPGHEAFTRMRYRGAQATDFVVLVVAADDGVMPQTIEAIDHAKAANVPIIVAINKIDKPNATPDRVLQQLADRSLLAEKWGGDTVTVEISAKNRINIDALLEMIVLVADMKELKASPKKAASGIVVEARLDRTRGAVATVLVQNGTLHIGDTFLAGAIYGRVRAMFDDRGLPIREAPPSTPVEVLGLDGVPQAGDRFLVLSDIDKAKKVSSYRQSQIREKSMRKSARLTLDQLHAQMAQGSVKELPIILKADVQGSVEVLTDTLNKLSTEKVKVRIIHSGTGAITESDVLLAAASNAIIIGFSVRPERKAVDLAEQETVDIRLHTIIYDISSEIRNAMVGLLDSTIKEKYMGSAEVRATFRVPKGGMVAGAFVSAGSIKRGASVRLLRDNVVIYEGRIATLRRFKDDADEVKAGYECGIGIERYNDLKVNDTIEAYLIEKILPTVGQL
ncbi:MAG: translation initiation factor IF-2 [Acidobacteria bacterium]|nr:translation initiation factor IF-2 [Acidobacteriota bacterium]MBI3657311.1 translation initiation factor IF-2 [Acidobacteriota bacterium]